MEILAFFLGTLFTYTHAFYYLVFIAVALFLKAKPTIIFWFISAFLWAYIHQWSVACQNMPDQEVINKASLVGVITSMPTKTEAKTQFEFAIQQLNGRAVSANAMLACYNHCPVFRAGQQWQFEVKLKRPRNLGNPGSFDYKGSLAARHFYWAGYVKPKNAVLKKENSSETWLLSLREYLADKLENKHISPKSLGIIQALTLGITPKISKAQWELFRRTGTTHLIVISGSHIALVAGFMYWLAYLIWIKAGTLALHRPAAQIASMVGIISAFIYTLLAGFAVPSQRSFWAFSLFLLRNFFSHYYTVWQAWRFALFLVLITEPHAVLLPGFYLSFMAVAILIAMAKYLPWQGIKKNLGLQLACLIGLMPFTLYWFSYGALNGFVANVVAIPLVGYAIVPLSLLSLILVLFDFPALLILVNWLVEKFLDFLTWVDKFAGINLSFGLSTISALFALMLALLLLLLPRPVFLLPALLLFFAGLFPGYIRPKEGEATVQVLDVGQGLSIVIRTAKHTLIYDTGMQFYQGGDMAVFALNPFLEQQGIKYLDKVVISHPDLDHRGGLASLEKHFPIGELLVNDPSFYKRGRACHSYPNWEWEGVNFRFLPLRNFFKGQNNNSCVLEISIAKTKLLLTGDIEKEAEHYLINTYPQLAADVLVVAHHGSKTSSSPTFIKKLSPYYAIISAGFDNRYRFPHAQTIKTLSDYKVEIFNTISCGMVTINMRKTGIEKPSCYKVATTN